MYQRLDKIAFIPRDRGLCLFDLGYEMFIDIKDMPADYEHLRTRLRIEQTRCLHWGEKVGLVEDQLDMPSKLLRWNHNLVIDILHEIQRAFRSSFTLTSKYDPYVTPQDLGSSPAPTAVARTTRHPSLQKVLSIWERGGRVAGKIEWSMLRKNSFEKLIVKLIQYNDRIESLLDRSALDDVRAMQAQSNLMLLQMTVQVNELQNLVKAIHIKPTEENEDLMGFSRSSTLVDASQENERSLASLAVFKAHYLRIEMEPAQPGSLLIDFKTLRFNGEPQYAGRQMAFLNGRQLWLEWRETADEFLKHPQYLQQIDERVQKLAAILSAPDKPAAFRSPKCIGYTKVDHGNKPRYALVNEGPDRPDENDVSFVSLRDLLDSDNHTPSLNARAELASMLAASVLYLHSVDWVHKDIRSDNVLFVREPDSTFRLSKPILAGFEFSRPALPEQMTVSHHYPLDQALYRHPDLITGAVERSSKSHDLYSLGLVLAEIALWKPVESIAQIEVRRRMTIHVQSRMLGGQYGVPFSLAERTGYRFSDAVMCCIDGSLSPSHEKDEEKPEVGAEMAQLLYEKVVQVLSSIKI